MPARPLLLAALLAPAAIAQTGTYTWQISRDNGQTWTSNATGFAGDFIKVRLLAGFSGVSGTDLAYSGGQFDGVLIGAGPADSLFEMRRPITSFQSDLYWFWPYSGGIKLDHSSDFEEPGAGTRWFQAGQAALDFNPPEWYFRDNPVVILTFNLFWSGNDIEFGMVFNPTQGRAMAVYVDSAGTQQRIDDSQVTVNTARLTIPQPATLALPLIASLFTRRRR